jgi:hypothetical protein
MASMTQEERDQVWETFCRALENHPTPYKLMRLRRLAEVTLEIHTHGDCAVIQDNFSRITGYLDALVGQDAIQALPDHLRRGDLQILSTALGSMGKCDCCPKYFLSNTNERTCTGCQSRSN